MLGSLPSHELQQAKLFCYTEVLQVGIQGKLTNYVHDSRGPEDNSNSLYLYATENYIFLTGHAREQKWNTRILPAFKSSSPRNEQC